MHIPRLMCSPSTITTGITASASMDFPHSIKILRDYPKIAQFSLLNNLFTKNLFFQFTDTFQDVKISS